ncbi:bifunctional ADP-dependent NAD(P)H-hydrate dehydratase/NAD(P)H-hydrate epimerase [Corynebacterium sp. A21]|uniref:bifunctional ADP-dependent NAD(P)H-hydrate dehydratase/NAD(P)H-hydrate epimerase n=1 Tax=Corynebacterium sp. A21 TaxID=3457318 RepID=UPI003FD3963A
MSPISHTHFVFSVDQVRRAEQVLLETETYPDQLMQEAAQAVAAAAEVMLSEPRPFTSESGRILLLVGSGGNGGDALYAGAFLTEAGHGVDAVLLGRDERVHIPALEAFLEVGGRIIDGLPLPHQYRLIIDGILGIGGQGGLSPEIAELLDERASQRIPLLAIDVPSGINADTGALPEKVQVEARGFAAEDSQLRAQVVPSHVGADVTVSFGGLRRAHAVAHDCGEVIIADLEIQSEEGPRSLTPELFDGFLRDFSEGAPEVQLTRAWLAPKQRFNWSEAEGAKFKTVRLPLGGLNSGPEANSDKYSGGVVGICAGSEAYRGAAVLCTTGAVRATSSLVRYIGSGWKEVVRALPEVIAHPDIESAGRVQAWVVGPGRGTDDAARAELSQLLDRAEPLLIDADALTLLSQHAELREKVRNRQARTLLTPHAGEFLRLAGSLAAPLPDLEADRLGAAHALAQELDCAVLLKGRRTVLAYEQRIHVTDAGSSWGATAGSGDVLAGIAGAWLAHQEAMDPRMAERYPEWDRSEIPPSYEDAEIAVAVHSVAAALAAQTPEGPAPTSASMIAAAIPRANAWLTSRSGR